jgi:hypothetical protein
MRNLKSLWGAALAVLVLVVGTLSVSFAGAGGEASRTGKPQLDKPVKGEKCVAPTDDMRRNHMNYLKQHRNEALREGIRTTQYSLKGCIECHASSKNNSVVGTDNNFCQGCHTYAAVKLDCFECHASKPSSASGFHPMVASKETGVAGEIAGAMRKDAPMTTGAAQ